MNVDANINIKQWANLEEYVKNSDGSSFPPLERTDAESYSVRYNN
jgi:hypothetical protein